MNRQRKKIVTMIARRVRVHRSMVERKNSIVKKERYDTISDSRMPSQEKTRK
jgi:hypothetical protein